MVWRFLKKLGIKPAYDPAIPLLGMYPKEKKLKKTHTPVFIAALFTMPGAICSNMDDLRDCHIE